VKAKEHPGILWKKKGAQSKYLKTCQALSTEMRGAEKLGRSNV
jgi:hypothetical protein